MGTDDLGPSVTGARTQLRKLLSKVRDTITSSARETVVTVLSEGLRALPIPFVGTFLANVVAGTLKPESRGPGLDDLMVVLHDMAESDVGFEQGLTDLGMDLEQLRDDLRAVRETQVGTAFGIRRATVQVRWPALDNQVSGLLINRGGGLIVLDEVYLDVEACEPVTEVDLTIPAAPLPVIRLRAELAPDRAIYPMFALNNEPPHQFASGLGAERLEIDLSSLHNARYHVRLRLAYYDDALGSDTELLWPAIEEPAVELPFASAPGWRRGLELLDRSAVIANAEARLGRFAEWLDRNGDPAELASLGIPEWIAQGPMLNSFARRMDEWVGELPDATTDLQAAVARDRDRGYPSMNANIYVQIPAYRDRELVPTLESLFREAAAPERLRVAVAWQFGPEEAHLERTLRSRSNVELHAIPAAESQGCNWARSLLQERWDGEPYTLLLDSHHRFVPGWDTRLVTLFEDVRSAGIAKPLLTSYLPPYDPRLEPAGRGSGLLQIQLLERVDGMMFRLVGHPVHNRPTVTAPFPAHFTSLHFLFTSGAFNDEVPFDASIYFFADEVAIALRAFTHGYELLHPHCSLGWHLYDRATRVTHWTDHGTWRERNQVSSLRLRALYRGRLRGRYGIGEDRTIGDYEAHIGLPLITPDTRHR